MTSKADTHATGLIPAFSKTRTIKGRIRKRNSLNGAQHAPRSVFIYSVVRYSEGYSHYKSPIVSRGCVLSGDRALSFMEMVDLLDKWHGIPLVDLGDLLLSVDIWLIECLDPAAAVVAIGEVHGPALVEKATPIEAIKSPIWNSIYCLIVLVTVVCFIVVSLLPLFPSQRSQNASFLWYDH